MSAIPTGTGPDKKDSDMHVFLIIGLPFLILGITMDDGLPFFSIGITFTVIGAAAVLSSRKKSPPEKD